MTPALFWASLSLLTWTWGLYPVVLFLLAAWRGHQKHALERWTAGVEEADGRVRPDDAPFVTVIIPVHDEESALPSKLQNCLYFDYPASRFEVVVASDGSQDSSADIARRLGGGQPAVRLVESPARIGKSAVQNLAAETASGDILLFTDVDARLSPDALRLVARQLGQPYVGCVSGHAIFQADSSRRREQSENLYWRFEHGLWRCEHLLGTLAWTSGPCMAVRRELFRPIDPQYGDDVVVPLDVIGQRWKVAYEPTLVVLERCFEHPAMALKARSRMTMRSLAATLSRRAVYNPWRRPGLFITVVSHKLLRWATPFLFIALLASASLLSLAGQPIARIVLSIQLAGLAAAALGHVTQPFGGLPVAGAAYELAVENLGVLIGVVRAALGDRQVAYPTADSEVLRATATSSGPPPRAT